MFVDLLDYLSRKKVIESELMQVERSRFKCGLNLIKLLNSDFDMVKSGFVFDGYINIATV